MKRKYLILLLIVILGMPVYAQYNSPSFKLASSANGQHSFENLTLTKDTIININVNQLIYGLSISGSCSLLDDESFVRVTLKDKQGHEYLVYENYTLLADNLNTNFSGVGIETVLLDGVSAHSLKIRVEKANLRLYALQYNTAAINNYSSRTADLRSMQVAAVVDKLNQHLRDRNMTWRAGVTSVAEMSYEEKKQMYGEEVPYMGGWEYYRGGIFVMPGYKPDSFATKSASATPTYVKEFDWRNRHGKNWMTPVKAQWGYTCWTFGSIGIVEPYINLYYNRLLDYDLSEQELISCIDPGYRPDTIGGYPFKALSYISYNGVVKESCFPFIGMDTCIHKCKNPDEIIRIGGYKNIYQNSAGEFEKNLFKSPFYFSIHYKLSNGKDWGHGVVMAGYKKIEEGDRIYTYLPNDVLEEIKIGNSLIGETAWLIKNSAGLNWGDQGYGYIITKGMSSFDGYTITGKISSLIYKDSDIVCEDNDGDGYYFWGIGSKPSSLPSWVSDEPDGDDSNADWGPMDNYGNLKDLNPNKLSPQIINMLTFWNQSNYIHTHLVIAKGGSLIISGDISMYKDATITVQPGGYLEIDGGKVRNANVVIYPEGQLKIKNGGILQRGGGDQFTAAPGAIVDIEYGGIE